MTTLPVAADALDAGDSHEPDHPLAFDTMAPADLELGMDPRDPICGSGGGIAILELVQELDVAPVAVRSLDSQS